MHTPAAFEAMLQRSEDGPLFLGSLDSYISLALCDEAAAVRILGMPFLIRPNDDVDLSAFDGLARLAESNLDGLQRVLDRPEFSDGITSDEAAFVLLLALEHEDPVAAAAIQELPWVEDGITYTPAHVILVNRDPANYEHVSVTNLVFAARHQSRFFWALLDTPWVRDGYTWLENRAILHLEAIAGDDEAAARLLRMPFLEDVDEDDLAILKLLEDLRFSAPVRLLLSSPELRDGITNDLKGTVALLALKLLNSDAAAAIAALPWLRDGIDPSEQDGLFTLWSVALASEPVLRALLPKSWMQDGLTPDESQVVRELAWMAKTSATRSDEAAALRLVDMPFLEAIGPLDPLALGSLNRLLWVWGSDEPYLARALAHPLLHNGITDDRTNLVAVLGEVAEARPDLLDVLLDPEQTLVEELAITLPLAGDMALSVIWPNAPPGSDAAASRLVSNLEDAVRAHEEFMGLPYPKNYAILLVADTGGPIGGGGPTSIIRVAHAGYASPSLIDHEVAHTYWPFHPTWIAEGAASFLDSIAARSRAGDPLPEPVDSCSLAENLAELVRLPHDMEEVVYGSGCNYALGEGMFLDLHRGLGDEAFRRGFANLYLLLRDDALRDECAGVDRGACYLKAAFLADATPRNAAIAEEIINRRYYGTSN